MITSTELKEYIRSNGIAFPGGYHVIALMNDGEIACYKGIRDNFKRILRAIWEGNMRDQWAVRGFEVHWEGSPLTCCITGGTIESEYGDPYDSEDDAKE